VGPHLRSKLFANVIISLVSVTSILRVYRVEIMIPFECYCRYVLKLMSKTLFRIVLRVKCVIPKACAFVG